jgi:hypothetical protein
MRARLSTALVALLAALVLSACGGDSPAEEAEAEDREQIEAVATEFADAVAAKDAKAFCAVLSPENKKRLRYEERKCIVVWGPESNPLFVAEDPDLSIEEITKIETPNATAKLANGGRLVFLKESGGWYVSLAPQGKE